MKTLCSCFNEVVSLGVGVAIAVPAFIVAGTGTAKLLTTIGMGDPRWAGFALAAGGYGAFFAGRAAKRWISANLNRKTDTTGHPPQFRQRL